MKHPFIQSQFNPDSCITCKRGLAEHGLTECEACSNISDCELFGKMLICPECYAKEQAANDAVLNYTTAINSPPIDSIQSIARAIQLDNSITTSKDYFNAETVAISELQSLTESDPTIENKHYRLAELVQERFNHLQKVLIELNEKRMQIASEQRAQQFYLNQLVTKLTNEEREKWKLHDINYKPEPTKPIGPKVMMSKEDRTIEKLAENYSKLMKIPIEQARQLVRNGLSTKP